MKALLAGAAALALMTGIARADFLPVTGTDIIDPTDLHVTGPGAGTTHDPVIVQSGTTFTVESVNNSVTIPQPIDVFFAVPNGVSAPTVSSVVNSTSGAVTFSGLTNAGTMTAGQNLYTVVGCTPCDNSLSFSNFNTALGSLVPPLPAATSYSILELMINSSLGPMANDVITGTFAAGTFIAPLGEDAANNKVYDTSFTNTGLIATSGKPPSLPEPPSLALLGIGLIMAAWLYRRRSA
jgi:hypothetical protein